MPPTDIRFVRRARDASAHPAHLIAGNQSPQEKMSKTGHFATLWDIFDALNLGRLAMHGEFQAKPLLLEFVTLNP